MVIIRKANNNDTEDIISLIRDFYSFYNDSVNLKKFDKDLVDIEKYYFENNGCFFVATNQQMQIIATLGFVIHPNKQAEFKRVVVNENYQRQRIATQMLKKGFDLAKEMNLEKVFLWSDVRYKYAHCFFEKLGFVNIKQKVFDNAEKQWTAFLFEKTL